MSSNSSNNTAHSTLKGVLCVECGIQWLGGMPKLFTWQYVVRGNGGKVYVRHSMLHGICAPCLNKLKLDYAKRCVH